MWPLSSNHDGKLEKQMQRGGTKASKSGGALEAAVAETGMRVG